MPDENNNDMIDGMWDLYQSDGIAAAVEYVKEQSGGDLEVLEPTVPYLVEEAKTRNIDLIEFLQDLDGYLETDNANRTDNGGSSLPSDVSCEIDQPEDEDESTQARDVDGEDRAKDQGV